MSHVGELAEIGLLFGCVRRLELGRQELAGGRSVVALRVTAVAQADDQAAPLVDVAVEQSPAVLIKGFDIEEENRGIA